MFAGLRGLMIAAMIPAIISTLTSRHMRVCRPAWSDDSRHDRRSHQHTDVNLQQLEHAVHARHLVQDQAQRFRAGATVCRQVRATSADDVIVCLLSTFSYTTVNETLTYVVSDFRSKPM